MPSKRQRRRLRKLAAAVGAPSGPAASSSRRILEPFLDQQLGGGGGGDDEPRVLRVLGSHRSIRSYQPDAPVSDEAIERALAAATAGSSSGNMQTWSVVVTREESARRRLWELHSQQDFILEAPVCLTFCTDWHRMVRWTRLRGGKPGYDNMLAWITSRDDAIIAAQNCAVALEAMGLGICYMGTTVWSMDGIADALGLPEGVTAVTSMVVGVPAEDPPLRDRLPLIDSLGSSGIVHTEKYRSPSDAELLSFYEERETAGWERYAGRGGGEWEAKMAQNGVRNLAQFCESATSLPCPSLLPLAC